MMGCCSHRTERERTALARMAWVGVFAILLQSWAALMVCLPLDSGRNVPQFECSVSGPFGADSEPAVDQPYRDATATRPCVFCLSAAFQGWLPSGSAHLIPAIRTADRFILGPQNGFRHMQFRSDLHSRAPPAALA